MVPPLRLLALLSTLLAAASGAHAQPPQPDSGSAPESESDSDSESDAGTALGDLPPPPAGGYAAPPGYAPGGQAAPAQRWQQDARPQRPRHVRVRYRDGMSVPPGGSLVSRYPKGLLLPGLIGFLVTYSMNLVSSTLPEREGAIMAIPIVGIPIWQARNGFRSDRPVVAVHTVVQLASVVLLAVGLIPRRYVEYFTVADRSKAGRGARWALTPRVDRHGGTLTLSFF